MLEPILNNPTSIDATESPHVRFAERSSSENSNDSFRKRRQHHKSFIMSRNIMEAEVSPSSRYLSSTADKFPLAKVVLGWLFLCSFVGSTVIYFFESRKNSYFSSFFLSASAFTNSGLNTISIDQLTSQSQVALCLLAFAGSTPMLSLIPVRVRMHFLERHIPIDLRTFTLSNFKVVPHWVVEYKALQFIFRLVMFYQIAFMLTGAIIIALLCIWSGDEHVNYEDRDGNRVATRWGFSVFTSIMAFTNSGISLRPTFRQVSPWLLVVVDVLCLAGNTFFPILLRWFIIFASKVSAVESNRKVYFRYLLMAGRNHYTHLFTSQQTWTLVSLQVFFLVFQSVVGRILGTKVNLNQAIFMAVNTRHAGFSAVDLTRQNSGILVLWAMMMFLAPTPFVVVLKSSAKEQDKQRLERSMSMSRDDLLDFRPSTFKFEPGSDPNESGEPRDPPSGSKEWRESEEDVGNSMSSTEEMGMEDVELEPPDAGYSSRRMASRILSMGLVENCEEAGVDTRMRLLKHYRGEKVPLSEVVSSRATALKESLSALWMDSQQASLAQYMGMLWFIWFLILSIEKFRPSDENSSIFNTLFEICSAFGNVGLSIGSSKHNNVSFSADLSIWSQILIIGVMIRGKTRELPPGIDGSLILTEGALVSESFLRPGAVVRASVAFDGLGGAIRQSEVSLQKFRSSWCPCWPGATQDLPTLPANSFGESLLDDLDSRPSNQGVATEVTDGFI